MSTSKSIRLFVLLFVSIEFLLSCDAHRSATSTILFFIICWLTKGLYKRFTTYSTYDEYEARPYDYGYDSGYWDSKYNTDYKPTTTRSYYSSYAEKEEEIKKNLFQMLKPNMHIVLDDEQRTEIMNQKKQKYNNGLSILSNVENDKSTVEKENKVTVIDTSHLLPPPPQTQTTVANTTNTNVSGYHDIIFIDNTSELSVRKKDIYSAIIKFLNQSLGVSCCKVILNNIKHIDVIDETDTIIIYNKDINMMSRYCVSSSEMEQFIKTECKVQGDIVFETYQPVTIYDYYERFNS